MRDYFTSIFLLSLLIGLLEKFIYKEKGEFGEKQALAVLLAFSLASPLPSLFSGGVELPLPPDFSGDGFGEGEYVEVTREAFESGIREEIADKFSLNEDSVTVRCSGFSFNEMKADKITVLLSLSSAGVDPRRIEEYVRGLEIGECEVRFEIR